MAPCFIYLDPSDHLPSGLVCLLVAVSSLFLRFFSILFLLFLHSVSNPSSFHLYLISAPLLDSHSISAPSPPHLYLISTPSLSHISSPLFLCSFSTLSLFHLYSISVFSIPSFSSPLYFLHPSLLSVL